VIRTVKIGGFEVGGERLTIIGGPCVIEDIDTCMETARQMKELTGRTASTFPSYPMCIIPSRSRRRGRF